MNEIREIVTKAVVAKGKKTINITESIDPGSKIFSVLGCWIINHNFKAYKKSDVVTIEGEMELNVWYSSNDNKNTEVARKTIGYSKEIKTRKIVEDYLDGSESVMIKIVQHPTCTNATINDELINVEIMFEALAEIVGETKMQVTISSADEIWDDEEDFTDEINEDFLTT